MVLIKVEYYSAVKNKKKNKITKFAGKSMDLKSSIKVR